MCMRESIFRFVSFMLGRCLVLVHTCSALKLKNLRFTRSRSCFCVEIAPECENENVYLAWNWKRELPRIWQLNGDKVSSSNWNHGFTNVNNVRGQPRAHLKCKFSLTHTHTCSTRQMSALVLLTEKCSGNILDAQTQICRSEEQRKMEALRAASRGANEMASIRWERVSDKTTTIPPMLRYCQRLPSRSPSLVCLSAHTCRAHVQMKPNTFTKGNNSHSLPSTRFVIVYVLNGIAVAL